MQVKPNVCDADGHLLRLDMSGDTAACNLRAAHLHNMHFAPQGLACLAGRLLCSVEVSACQGWCVQVLALTVHSLRGLAI